MGSKRNHCDAAQRRRPEPVAKSNTMSIGRFYAGVGALVWCASTQKYLVLKRSADKDFGGGAWECVTGQVKE
jgi:hypothetical protein